MTVASPWASPRSPHRAPDQDAWAGGTDLRAIVLSGSAQDALETLKEGLAQGDALLLLTGKAGTGKTMLSRILSARAAAMGVRSVFVKPPHLDFASFLREVAGRIGIDEAARTAFEHLRAVQRRLDDLAAQGGRVLVVIEEAQALDDETLEGLRLLVRQERGYEGARSAQALQVLLVGEPHLERILRRRELRAVEDQIGARARLSPMRPSEAREWMSERLAQAGRSARSVFTPAALDAVARHGRGAPRTMERLARRALWEARARRERTVRRDTVLQAAVDLSLRKRGVAWRGVAAAAALIAAMGVGALGWRAQRDVQLQTAQRAIAARRLATAAPPSEAGSAPLRAAAAVSASETIAAPGPATRLSPRPRAALRPGLR